MRRNPPHGKGTTTHSADYAAPERKWQIKTQPSCAANPPYMGEILYAVRGLPPCVSSAKYKYQLSTA
ncbi:MAG: hypothetical protein HOP36_10130 [Methyloglobulus sp.]|nr:hypothetical protein [Methyloglobulus sp.]